MLVLALTACEAPVPGLRVDILVEAEVKADRLRLDVFRDQAGAEFLESASFERPADNTAVVAVRKGETWPQRIFLRVDGLVGTCAEDGSGCLGARSAMTPAEFPERLFNTVTVDLGLPGSDLDSDGDGFIDDKKGGSDCNDLARHINPAATQRCAAHDEDTDCNGYFGCDDPFCTRPSDVASACANPPTRLVLVDGGAPSASGLQADGGLFVQESHACFPLVYELRGADGGVAPAVRNTPVRLAGTDLEVLTGCVGVTEVTNLTISHNSSTLQLFARSRGPVYGDGNVHLEADVFARGDALTTAVTDTPVPLRPTPVTALAFSTDSVTSVTAGTCSSQPMTLRLLDASGRPTLAPASGLSVNLDVAGPHQDVLFAPGCDTLSSPLLFAPGQGQQALHVKHTKAGNYAVSATRIDGDAGVATHAFIIAPAEPHALRLDRPEVALASDVCDNQALGVTLVDAFDNDAPAPANTLLSPQPTASLADVTFHNSPDCLDSDTTYPLAAGTSHRTLPLRGTTQATGTLTVDTNLPGVLPTGLFTVSVAAGPPASLDFTGTGQDFVVGNCVPTPLALRVRDTAGNPAAAGAGGLTVTFDLANPGENADLRYSTNVESCLDGGSSIFIPPGSASASVYFSGTRARTAFGLRASSSLPVDGGVDGHTLRAGPPMALVLSPDAGHVTAGPGCAVFSARTEDRFRNAASFTTERELTLAPAQPNLRLGPDAACGAGLVLLAANTSARSFSLGANVANTYDFTVQLGSVNAPLRLTVDAGPPVLRVTPTAVSADAGDCVDLQLRLTDAVGNPTPVAGATDFGATPFFDAGVYGQFGCEGLPGSSVNMAAAAHQANLSVRPFTAGTGLQLVFDGGSAGSPSVSFDVAPGAVHALTIEGTLPQPLVAGTCNGPVQARRVDQWGNAVLRGTVNANVSTSLPGLSFHTSTTDCDDDSPSASTTPFSDGSPLSGNLFLYGTRADAGSITVSLGAALGSRAVAVSPTDAQHVSFTADGGTTSAGNCLGASVELRDRFDNRVTPGTPVNVVFSTDGGLAEGGGSIFSTNTACDTTLPGSQLELSSAQPTRSFGFRSVRATPAGEPMRLFATTTTPASTAAQSWVVTPLAASRLVWTTPPPTSVTRFACVSLGRVGSRDFFGNVAAAPAGGWTLTPSAAAGLGAAFYGDDTCVTPPPSELAASNIQSGEFFVSATGSSSGAVGVAPSVGSATPAHTLAVTGAQGSLLLSPNTASIEAGGCLPMVLHRRDDQGNLLTRGGPITVSLSSDNGIVEPQTGPECGSRSLTVNVTFDAGVAQRTVWVRGNSSDSETATLTASDQTNGSADDTASVTALPLVRSADCDLATGNEVRCELSPPIPGNDLSRSFVVFSSTAAADAPSLENVGCFLDATGDAAVVCRREGTSDSPDAAVKIRYQVVSFATGYADGGVSVQQRVGNTAADDAGVSIDVVNPDDSFVLFSSWTSGGDHSADDFATAHLEGNNLVALQRAATGATLNYALQVVSWQGASVRRGELTLAADAGTASVTPTGGPTTNARSFLLLSTRAPADADNGYSELCKRGVRGMVNPDGSLSFSRGLGSDDCDNGPVDVRWELVQLPGNSSVQHGELPFSGSGANEFLTATQPMATFSHRALPLLAGQGPGGQSGGESSFFNTNEDRAGSFRAALRLVGNNVQAVCRNPGPSRDSRFSPMVIQFDP